MIITPEEIRTRRVNLALSQMELAEKLTVSQNTIARWERGELEPEHPGMLILAFQALEQAFIKPQTEAQLAKRRKKIFDVLKNEFDGNRLRTHSHSIVESRLFIKFLALVLYSLLSHKMKSSDLFKLFSIKEIFYELKKLKIISINSHFFYLSELSKKQKTIFSKLSLKTPSLSS